MLINRFIGAQIRALCSELIQLSDKQFRHECLLFQSEKLGISKRITMRELTHGKVSIVNSLCELKKLLHGVDQFLFRNQRVEPGYESVAEIYFELLALRWIIAAEKYQEGYDPTPNLDWKTYAYGLIKIDDYQIDRLRSELDRAEIVIREKPLPEPTDQFRITYLTKDLKEIGIPTCGICSPISEEKIENNSQPCCYFKLNNGSYVRVDLDGISFLTEEQKQIAHRIILRHEELVNRQIDLYEEIEVKLLRAGFGVEGIRFRRMDSELSKRHPKRSVAVDTEMGILEIHTEDELRVSDRNRIKGILSAFCNSRQIQILNPEDIEFDETCSKEVNIHHVDIIGGDKVMGDKIGNQISNSNIANVVNEVKDNAHISASNFTQTSCADIAELLELTIRMRQSLTKLPTERQEDLSIEINHIEEELKKIPDQHNKGRLKKQLMALLAGVSVAATGVSNGLEVTNNLIEQVSELGNKVGIELHVPPKP